MSETFPALCAHTHLFPGARLRVQGLPDPAALAAALGPPDADLDLRFADGSAAEGRLRAAGPDGAETAATGPAVAELAVAGYTTAAGTRLDARTWEVRASVAADGALELTVGGRSAG
ncbi:hypothetical protein K353_05663 [Kitasatospora sp. SolWspMP-SS2h]|uniref:hypothetical protein n=1 Tax=Kitasatospora sp. SolWspMP-SS2h TaxID=1305729 RepID=UPI000DB99350|nr:hypothetical protein [Kitasatospora sp. SolWspMP-SS2h]RAJ33267.1 hypothetical protein K353_05663 [Kitasatospora sp. SolWspMP-SS2h]